MHFSHASPFICVLFEDGRSRRPPSPSLWLARDVSSARLIAKGDSHVVTAQDGRVGGSVQAHQAGGDDARALCGGGRDGDPFLEVVKPIRLVLRGIVSRSTLAAPRFRRRRGAHQGRGRRNL